MPHVIHNKDKRFFYVLNKCFITGSIADLIKLYMYVCSYPSMKLYNRYCTFFLKNLITVCVCVSIFFLEVTKNKIFKYRFRKYVHPLLYKHFIHTVV